MFARRSLILLGLLALATACSDTLGPRGAQDGLRPPATFSGPSLLRAPWAQNATPAFRAEGAATAGFVNGGWDLLCDPDDPCTLGLASYQATFYAVRGKARTLQINYSGADGTTPFMQLTVSDPTYVPGQGALAEGDSVLITATVDPASIVVELQPHGTRFGTPAQLTLWYGGAKGDLNGDGAVDATDAQIEQSMLQLWYRQTPTDPWTLFSANKDLVEKSFTAALQHFSGYGVAW